MRSQRKKDLSHDVTLGGATRIAPIRRDFSQGSNLAQQSHGLIALQRMIGNRAVAGLQARRPGPVQLHLQRAVDPGLEHQVVSAEIESLVEEGVLQEFPGGVTKKVFRCVDSPYVLAVATTEAAERALRGEVKTLEEYQDAGLRSALHEPLSTGETFFNVNLGGVECVAAFQPFVSGVMAQLRPKEGDNATKLIDSCLKEWKAGWKADTASIEGTHRYAEQLQNIGTGIKAIAEHFAAQDMFDLQFFIDEDSGTVTLFDPGDAASSMTPTNADKDEVKKWPKWIEQDVSSLERSKKKTRDQLVTN